MIYITTAGVYRCCIISIGHEYSHRPHAGDKSTCEYCNEPFTLTKEEDRLTWIPDWQLKEKNADVAE